MRYFIPLALVFIFLSFPNASVLAGEWYQEQKASKDGIGKLYMGREISQVMGHRAANWLERENREAEERTDLLIENLEIKETDIIADIGAGTGYFTFRLAPLVPNGEVIAVDIQKEMLEFIENKKGDQ
jgi:SAM-dependent methyltransferase